MSAPFGSSDIELRRVRWEHHLLLVAGVAAVLASWQIEQAQPDFWFIHVKSGLTYPGSSYLPAAFVVAIMTTVVNRATFIEEPADPPAKSKDPAPAGAPTAPANPAPAAAESDEVGTDGLDEARRSHAAPDEPAGPSTTDRPT